MVEKGGYDMSIDKVLKEFADKFCYKNSEGTYDLDVTSSRKTNAKFITDFIRQVYAQAEARGREEAIRVVEKYEDGIIKYHQDMIGKTHKDSKIMLLYDMDSRLVAIKHIKDLLTDLGDQNENKLD